MNLKFRHACFLIALTASIAARLPVQAADASCEPIQAMGWNTDVVFENTPAPSAKSFDNLNQKQTEAPLYAWFESGLEGHADGLPASRRLASAANTNVLFELQPYNTNNVLLLTATKRAGNLTLAKPSAYRTLFILGAAGGGDNAATLQLHFSGGGDTEVIIPCPVSDWWTSAEGKLAKTPALSGLGRSNGNERFQYEEHGDDAFALYQIKIDLAKLGLDRKPITSLTFKMADGGGTVGIFAISGEASKSPE